MTKAATKTKENEPVLFGDNATVQIREKSQAVAIQSPRPTSLLAAIMGAAADKRVDVVKMKELMAMQREIEQAQDVAMFNRALTAAQVEMPKIVTDKQNTHTNSRYASLEKVSTDIDKIVRKHGFSMSFGTADSPLPKHYRIVCDLSHSYGTDEFPRGSTRRYFVDLESDVAGSQGKSNKTPIQGVGSTISYGRRYLKVMMFDLVIVGEDKDGNRTRVSAQSNDEGVVEETATVVPKVSAAQVKELLKEIEACGVPAAKFIGHFAIKAVHELPVHQYDDAVAACRKYGKDNPPKQKRNG